MAEWPESHVIVILEAETRGTQVPRGSVALRDPEDGMYISTSLENGRLWLDPQVDQITSWIDISFEHIEAVQCDATPKEKPITEDDTRDAFRDQVLTRQVNTARYEEWWPVNEITEVDWEDKDSVCQAVLSAYYACSYFASELIPKAIEIEAATIEQVKNAAREALSAVGSTDAVDNYAVVITSYWLHKFATR